MSRASLIASYTKDELKQAKSSAMHGADSDVDISGGDHCDDMATLLLTTLMAMKTNAHAIRRAGGEGGGGGAGGAPGYFRLISLLTSLSIVPTMSGVNAVKTTLYSDI